MTTVLVTGATGTVGRHIVDALGARGCVVRAMSRHAGDAQGDVLNVADVERAVAGVDAVVHGAINYKKWRRTEIEGTRNVATAAARAGAHFVYISIVGIDGHRYPYYKAKVEAERILESTADLQWTIQRATQFHELLDLWLSKPVFATTSNLAFRPVDPRDVATRLADVATGKAVGRAADFAGPETVSMTELCDVRRQIVGQAARLIRLPRIGMFRDFDNGAHLGASTGPGKVTWREWLAQHRVPPNTR